MALTPEDVSSKRFTTVRLREGYDMTEVDQFLDEVEAELERMTREADELRAKLHAAQTGEPMPEPEQEPAAPAATEAPATPEPGTDQTAASASVETLQVTTTAEASVAAARLLELAGNNADALVSEARQQADQIVGEARSNAESLEAEAKQRAESLEAETEERRTTLLADLEQEKTGLDAEIERLRTFEREYRAELRAYFVQQLSALDGNGPRGELAGPGQPATEQEQSTTDDGSQDGSQGSDLRAVMKDDSPS